MLEQPSPAAPAPVVRSAPATEPDLQPVAEPDRPPAPLVATYRVQCTPAFTLHDAAALTGYLLDLGVSHLYTSPLLQARPGSTHGYDVIDHRSVNAELGGEPGLDALRAAVRRHDLRLLVDVVPNHMAITVPGNRWWYDVLRNGRASRYADFFDIDWDPPQSKLSGRILIPVLPDHYGTVLEDGGLRLVRHHDEIVLTFADLLFPLDPRAVGELARLACADADDPELHALVEGLVDLPGDTSDPAGIARRAADEPALSARLAERWRADEALAAGFDRVLDEINDDPDRLDALLDEQHYRLARWQTSGQELDYRRFFDVDDLVGLRTERAEVFDEIHERVLGWVHDGTVAGIRIDHVDGLRDPMGYLCELRARAPGAWIVVEKILEPGEELRPEWPVDGTTGYELGALVNQLFVDPSARTPLAALRTEFSRLDDPVLSFEETLHQAKHDVMTQVLAAEVSRLTESLARVCEQRRDARDFTHAEQHAAITELLAAFPVYRTYLDDTGGPSAVDVEIIEEAVAAAVTSRPDLEPRLLELVRSILLREPDFDGPAERELRTRFQQTSGPVMAKSKEDTAFYRWCDLLCLTEVGGDPTHFGVEPETFHERCATTQRLWPSTMVALSTHDSKRSEDVRARLAVLSEMPLRWAATARGWHQRSAAILDRHPVHPTDELYLLQTIVGAHPISVERLQEHAQKALREAKVRTSWLDPDEEYEGVVAGYIRAVLTDTELLGEIDAFVAGLLVAARTNALSQKLLQLTVPGVPDIYQGQELWGLRLVDPDNRAPVDFGRRRELLEQLRADPRAGLFPDLADPADEGLSKLLVVERALAVRRRHATCFGPQATYEPLTATGASAQHVVAFARGTLDATTAVPRPEVITLVPRLVTSVEEGWDGTTITLPPGPWHDAVRPGSTWEGTIGIGDLLAAFPVSLLERAPVAADADDAR
jgi:(1->4)-alpha-D-glucan 1-alpha-D-glucosylmutase